MGEVFRARDTRLNRDVAIKVLPPLFADDPDRLARFSREAQTLAALNHPNIAQIHGLEESQGPGSGVRALVMELVEGEDLSSIIGRGPVSVAEALPIARQIADALEAAHDIGIIHRDLKPANVKVRPDGTVKVLDFGLAKALDPADSNSAADALHSPTMTQRATAIGTIIGTAAYMAPEQARGKTVDRRADIWAFGVVLYEMLTGARGFPGDDLSEVLATVLKTEPNWHALPPETPPAVRRLLRRCLEKDPRKRLSSIADARLELEESDLVAAPATSPSRAGGIRPLWVVGIVVAAMAATAAAMLLAGSWKPGAGSSMPGAVTSPIRLTISLPPGDELTDTNYLPLAISPDGSRIAYVGLRDGRRHLFLRSLSDVDSVLLPNTEGGRMPFFSPDGQWIGFFTNTQLKKLAVASGAVQNVIPISTEPRGACGPPMGRFTTRRTTSHRCGRSLRPAPLPLKRRSWTRRAARSATAGRSSSPMARCCSRRGPAPATTSTPSSITILRPTSGVCWRRPATRLGSCRRDISSTPGWTRCSRRRGAISRRGSTTRRRSLCRSCRGSKTKGQLTMSSRPTAPWRTSRVAQDVTSSEWSGWIAPAASSRCRSQRKTTSRLRYHPTRSAPCCRSRKAPSVCGCTTSRGGRWRRSPPNPAAVRAPSGRRWPAHCLSRYAAGHAQPLLEADGRVR